MADFKSPEKPKNNLNRQLDAKTPPRWKRPDEVMRLHRLRMKHNALQARMSKTQIYSQTSQSNDSFDSVLSHASEKRKNPFRKSETFEVDDTGKRIRPFSYEDDTNNFSVFNFLQNDENNTQEAKLTSFKNIFSRCEKVKVETHEVKGSKEIPVDWKLRTKVRFMSLKPFAWNSKLKTCEEASGTTAFVRCLDTTSNSENCYLDMSANARFHQRCLVWQHPHLPWVELYPRHAQLQNNAAASLFAVQSIRDSMHKAWTESFRSVFQLVRAQQCPYFYILANSFTCLFRAAGVCGHSELHALITPTTRGFRQALKAEEIEFTMPLKESDDKRRSFENQSESGYNTLDNTTSVDDACSNKDELSSHRSSDTTKNEDQDDELEDDDEQWLQSMGVDETVIKKISSSHNDIEFNKESQVDKTSESLVYIEGIEAQALFNFLMNCKSNIAVTGPLAGVPPTILAPTAFHGATLTPLKVRQNTVNMGIEKYYSMEIRGPVLPHTVHSLAHLLKESSDTFSLTFASIESTSPFTSVHKKRCVQEDLKDEQGKEKPEPKVITPTKPINNITAFCQVNLSDCGLNQNLLKTFCKSDLEAVQSFDSLKYSDSLYTWS